MIQKGAAYLAKFMGRQLQVTDNQVEVYSYGLEILLGSIVKFVLLVISALLLHILSLTMLVLLTFAGFRIVGGGVHLSTYNRCLVVGVALILALAKLSTLKVNDSLLIIAFVMVALFAIYTVIRCVPAGTEKKVISNKADRKKQKLETGLFSVIWMLVFMWFLRNGYSNYSLALILGASGSLFLITPGGYRMMAYLERSLDQLREGVLVRC